MEKLGPTIGELGESESLRRATAHFRTGEAVEVGSGDDAAVVRQSEPRFVVTTDTMVEGRDFRKDFSTGFDLGYKAVASNLADVVAMGAKPTSLVVALVTPGDTPVSWLEDFAKGVQSGIDELAPEAAIVGGDLAGGESTVIAVTAHGDLEGRKPILRSAAKAGDRVCIAGTLGKAAAGLDLLLSGDKSLADAYEELVSVQLRPKPPLSLVLQTQSIVAMMDISDSLALDCYRLAKASGVKIEIDSSALHGYEAVLELAAQSIISRGRVANPGDWVLFGGEDHSFLALFREGDSPKGFRQLGVVSEGAGVFLDGEPLEPRGWDSTGA